MACDPDEILSCLLGEGAPGYQTLPDVLGVRVPSKLLEVSQWHTSDR